MNDNQTFVSFSYKYRAGITLELETANCASIHLDLTEAKGRHAAYICMHQCIISCALQQKQTRKMKMISFRIRSKTRQIYCQWDSNKR
jgi:hypothetical protein